MRKNFTQKFLTIFAFLFVIALGNQASAQEGLPEGNPAPQCTGDDPGRIAFASNCSFELQECRGVNIGLIRGDAAGCGATSTGSFTGGNVAQGPTGPGNGFGGGPTVSYQWFYRTSTSAPFVPVPVNAAAGVDGTGTGVNYVPTTILTTSGRIDFVRQRYTGTLNVPRTCVTTSNIVVAYNDITPPVISDCAIVAPVSNNAGSCFAIVTLPRPGNFGTTAARNVANGVDATDNCSSNGPGALGVPAGDTMSVSYRVFRSVGDTVLVTEGSGFTYSFPIGVTRVFAYVTDSSGNRSLPCEFSVTVNDTSKPVYGGLRNHTRFTEQNRCDVNITGTELAPMYTDCSVPLSVNYQILDSTTMLLATPVQVTNGPTTGTFNQTTSGSNQNFGDRIFQRGTYYIVYRATDPAGNFSGTNTAPTAPFERRDTLKLRVVDAQLPTITAPANDTFAITSGCTLPVSSITVSSPVVGSTVPNCGQTSANTTNLCTDPITTDNCGVVLEQVYGPNDIGQLFNTFNNTVDAIPDYDNRFFNIGRNVLGYVVTDIAGNRSSATQEIYVRDASAPRVFCQTNETLNTTGESRVTADPVAACRYRVSGLTGTFDDNCRVRYVRYQFTLAGESAPYFDTTVNITTSTASGSYIVNGPFRIGQTTVRSVAHDTTGLATPGSNASLECTFVVNIVDNTQPTILTCNAGAVRLDAAGSGQLTPLQIGTAFDCGPGGATLTLSKTSIAGPGSSSLTYGCGETGTQTVYLIATDAAGNRTVCQTTVTVRSNITITSAITPTFCASTGAFTITPAGGTGPNYNYDVTGQNPAGPDPANPAAGTTGRFTGLAAGTYNVRITDATTGCSLDTTVVVGNGAKMSTDVSLVAEAPVSSNNLTTANTNATVNVRVQELGGFATSNVTFFVSKSSLPSGVTIAMVSGAVNNSDWTMSENPFVYTFTKTSGTGGTGLTCGQLSTVQVRVSRTAGTPAGTFAVSFSLGVIPGQLSDYEYNDSYSRQFVTR